MLPSVNRGVFPPVLDDCPVDLFQGALNDRVYQAGMATKAPRALVVQGALSAMSYMVQNLVDVEKPNGEIVPPVVFFIGVAESGERKTAIEKFFFDRIEERELEIEVEREALMTEYEVELSVWKERKRRLIKECSKFDAEENEEAVKKLYNHEKSKPACPSLLPFKTLSDATPEAALSYFYKNGVKSAILRSSEGEHFFTGRASQKLSVWNSLWSGDSIRVDRKTTESFVIQPRLTMYVQVQPSVMRRFVSQKGESARGIGFFARTMICFPASTQGTRPVEAISDSSSEVYNDFVDYYLDRNVDASEGRGGERKKIAFSLSAKERWFVIANAIEREIFPGGTFEKCGDHASKLADNIARVAVLLHCADSGLEGEVSLDELERAIMVCFWFSDQFVRLFKSSSEEQEDYMALQAWMNDKRNQNVRYIQKNHIRQYGPNRLRKSSKLGLILDMMMNNGEIGREFFGKKEIVDLFPNWPRNDLWLCNSAR